MITLVNPGAQKPPTATATSQEYAREPPLGLLYMASLLEAHGYGVQVKDFNAIPAPLEDVVDQLAPAAIVGFTCLTNNSPWVRACVAALHARNPDQTILVGGPHATFQARALLAENPGIDVVVRGEAEAVVVPLVAARDASKARPGRETAQVEALARVPNLTYRGGDGTPRETPRAEPVDLDGLPLPARHALPGAYDVAHVIVNRGCTSRCSFCVRRHLFQRTRVRSPASVLAELGQIARHGTYVHVNLYDNVNLHPRALEKLCRGMRAEGWTLPWGAEVRADRLSLAAARLMRSAGCQGVAVGVETGNQALLERHGKHQSLADVRRGLVNAKAAGLVVQAYFVVGLPGETRATFADTREFLARSPLVPGEDLVNMFMATPYPGTRLWEEREAFGITDLDRDFARYDCDHVLFETAELPRAEFAALRAEAKEIERAFQES